jgi:uncharacterized protein (DUF433 family)
MNDRIEINPAICHGQPVIKGTRITVSQLLGALAGGDTVAMILEDYPSLSFEDISSALSFASNLATFEESLYEPSLV